MPDSIGSLSNYTPPSFLRTWDQVLLVANGIDKIKRWDGLTAAIENAGIPAPTAAPGIAVSDAGSISGDYRVAYRFLDDSDQPGNLSPTADVTATNNRDFDYSTIPGSHTDSRVTQVQLLRTTAGQTETFYVDTTFAIGSTTFTSTKTDAQLIAGTAVPLLNADGTLHANRFGVPPDTKSCMASLQDRVLYAVDVTYNQGHAVLTNASATVTGRGTGWTENMAGRYFYVKGHATAYLISSVNASTQVVTLATNYTGTTDIYGIYAIAADPETINTIYFSEALESESVPASQNTLVLDEDEDYQDLQTAICRHGANVYLFKERHLYRISFINFPPTDGAADLVACRGCCNSRSYVIVEDVLYVMDYDGIYAFNGAAAQPISLPIQDIFRERRINWGARKWFDAAHDCAEGVIRFFVALDSDYLPKQGICYNYRLNRWWIEEYPFYVGAAIAAQIEGRMVPCYGIEHTRIAIPSGFLDLSGSSVTPRSTIAASTWLSLTDTAAAFGTNAVGQPLVITGGRGKNQLRRVVAQTGTVLTIDEPWDILPSSTPGPDLSEYQLGGIPWRVKFGKFPLPAMETSTTRQATIHFTPTQQAGSIDLRRYSGYDPDPTTNAVQSTYGLAEAASGGEDIEIDTKLDRTEGGIPGINPGCERIQFDEGFGERSQAARTITLELRGVQGPVDSVVINAVTIEGVAG